MMRPSDEPVPSKETNPATSGAKSLRPEPARSSCATFSDAFTGVIAEFVGLIGPARPFNWMVPPPATLAASVNGNAVVAENSRSLIVT